MQKTSLLPINLTLYNLVVWGLITLPGELCFLRSPVTKNKNLKRIALFYTKLKNKSVYLCIKKHLKFWNGIGHKFNLWRIILIKAYIKFYTKSNRKCPKLWGCDPVMRKRQDLQSGEIGRTWRIVRDRQSSLLVCGIANSIYVLSVKVVSFLNSYVWKHLK